MNFALNSDASGTMASKDRLPHKFLLIRKLGQGTYGKVQLALNKETHQEVAIKTIKKAKIGNEEDMLRIRREIHIMTSIRHPHIIHIHEVFETRQKIIIVMQYASGGELYDYLGCHQTLPEAEARRLYRQIASAIYYCHKNKICHRDLKLENILLDEKGNAQIADFGLSNIFDDRRQMNTFCGSPLYASPEIVKGTPYKGPEVDCWSLGVLLYTLIYGTMPFDGRNFKELVTQISEGKYEEPIFKSGASGLIRRLLTPEISRRATIFDVCQDRWVNEGYNESLLNDAEKMASEAFLKTKSLAEVKFLSVKNGAKNGSMQSILRPLSNTGKKNEENASFSNNKNSEISGSCQIAQKASIHEQILKYDVSFMINKLLTAVESSLNSPQTETDLKTASIPSNDIARLTPKPWIKNVENNLVSKVDSAYVIPIFDVTSVVPKACGKKKLTNKELPKQCNAQNSIPNGCTQQSSEMCFQKDSQINLSKSQKKEMIHQPPTIQVTNEEKIPQKEFTNIHTGTMLAAESNNPKEKTSESSLKIRNPSVKIKRARENQLLGLKHFGLFFRGKNNILSLAHVFSMKYETRNSVKLPDRKKKPPGKIEIPATFDPASLPDKIQESKEIVLFPTVSVSENREKIEKKIDKIKKAALNRNLILRSNSMNRLKIQKYLKSQAKKMQDLVCDEQRSINGSTEQINSFSSNLNVKMHNKKMNFTFKNASNCKLSSETLDFGILMLSKSKSDILFPIHHANCTTTYNDRVGCLGDKSSNYLLSVSPINYNTKLLRSVSDSEGLNNYKNVGKTGANRENYQVSEVFNNGLPIKINIPFHAYNNTSGTETVYQNEPTSYLSLSSNESCSEICQKDLEKMKACNYENEGKNNLSKTKNPTNIRITNENGVLNVKQSSSAYLFENKEWNYKAINGKDFSNDDLINKTKFSELISDAEACDSKQKGNRRRNTLSCIQDFDNSTMQLRIESIRGKSVDSYSELDKWTSQSEQEFRLSREKDEMKFSSFPNLSSALANHKAIFKSDSNSKNHKRSENSIQSSQENSPFLKSSGKSEFLRRILQSSDPSELFSRRISRANEDKFLYNGSDEIQNERKLAMPTSKKIHGKSPFLSKFLNDLENRTNNMNGNFSQLRYSKSSLVPGKQPKLEKRSQSFLQLLSLKRIQEAEKEIEKVEKEVKMDEDSAGSLLEALKTHGYKGVLSQRFQGTEDSSQDGFNRYNSTGPFLIRKNIPEFSGLNYMYYDNTPQFTSSNYDVNNLDMINDLSMKSFEMYSDFRQNSPKQFVSDWLATTNHNGECSSPLNADLDSYPESEMFNSVKKAENASCFGKETFKSLDDEDSSSESFDTLTAGTPTNESIKTRDYFGDYPARAQYAKTEKNPLHLSSTSEDEKQESVQDRIWRKSFYSRFNNSALSRKERTGFFDLHFSPETRAGLNSPILKLTNLDGIDNLKLNGCNKDLQQKRIQTAKKYSSTNDVASIDYMRVKTPVEVSGERTADAGSKTELDDLDAEY